MRNFDRDPLDAEEEASLLAELKLETEGTHLRSTFDLKSDAGRIMFTRTALLLTPAKMAQLFRLPEYNFRIPEEAQIPTKQENPALYDRFLQIVGVACFLNRVIKDPFSRDDFLRTDRGIFAMRSPMQTLIELDPLPAFALIKDSAEQWGSMYSEQGPRRPLA